MNETWRMLSQRVEAAIGRPLPDTPDLGDRAFLQLLAQLRQVDPALSEDVINALTGTSQRLPSEDEADAERRRERVRGTLFNRFFRPDALRTGRVRFNLRKTLNWTAVALAFGIIVWSAIPKSGQMPLPSANLQPSPSRPSAPTPAGPVATAPPGATSPQQQPGPPADPQLGGLLPGFPPAAGGGTGTLLAPPIPDGSVPPAGGGTSDVIVFQTAPPQASGSPVVYQRDGQKDTSQVIVHQAEAKEQSAASPQAGGASVIVYEMARAQPPGAGVGSGQPGQQGTTAQQPTLPRRGQIVEAKLITPVAVSAGWGASPVLAEIVAGSLQGAVLFGQATLASDGLINIQFTMLITPDGREHAFTGAAYDRAIGRMGVAGQVSTMMPGSAAAAAGAGLQATSDYFTALARRQQVTITDGWLTITQGVPTFWESLAAAMARAFVPVSPRTTGSTVVTRVDRGQTIAVMVI